MSNPATEKNPKVQATAAIWGCATGMFGICIPLTAITKSGALLPLLVVLGAGAGTAAVWLAPEKRRSEEMVQMVEALEERVTNLEVIYTSLPDIAKPLPLSKANE